MNRWLAGMLAGAAGTTALNAVSYADMVVRGRGPSSTPARTATALARLAGVDSLGPGAVGAHRAEGIGALLGIGTGLLAGTGYGALSGGRGRVSAALALAGLAMTGSVVPMTVLKITDPRQWSTSDWLSDLVPHLAYGVVAAAALRGLRR